MGTISEKLTYLNDTRLKIKENLNKFGSNITENDTFRSYSNVINDIYDKLPKVSGNGSDFSLENVQNGKLDSFGMDGNTEQDSYTGQQLFNVHDNPTYDQYITLEEDYIICERTNTGTEIASSQIYTNNLNVQPSTTYLCVCEIIEVSGTGSIKPVSRWVNQNQGQFNYDTAYAFSSLTAGQKLIYPVTTFADLSNKTRGTRTVFEFRAGEGGRIKIRLSILMDTTITSDTFVYEPYCGGVAAPNPDYPQDVRVVENEQNINVHGKNLIEGSQDFSGIWNNSQNWETDTNSYNNLIVKKNQGTWNGINKEIYITAGTYTFSLFAKSDSARTVNIYLGGTLTTDNLIPQSKQLNLTTEWQRYDVTFTSNANGTVKPRLENPTQISNNYTYVCGYQLQQGNLTEYEPYQSQDFEIDLLDYKLCKIGDYKDVIFKNNQLSSYYDSTLDEDSWYIKKEIGKVVVDTSNITLKSNYTNIEYAEITKPNDFIGKDNYDDYNVYCSHAISDIKNAIQYAWDSTYRIGKITNKATTSNLWLGFPKGTGLDNIKIVLNGAVIYYPLATPTYETITDETLISQLEAIETETGTNIFEVSNDNDVLPTLYVSRLKELGKLE